MIYWCGRPLVTWSGDKRKEVEGLVVIAGGDGSVRAVVGRLVGRAIAFIILPLGTANNIAHTLGIEGRVDELLAGLAEPRKQRFDVGRVRFRDRDISFLEGAGCGLLANAFAGFHKPGQEDEDEDSEKSLADWINVAIAARKTDELFRARIIIDGDAWEGGLPQPGGPQHALHRSQPPAGRGGGPGGRAVGRGANRSGDEEGDRRAPTEPIKARGG